MQKFARKFVSLLLVFMLGIPSFLPAYAAQEKDTPTWRAQAMGQAGDLTLPDGALVPTASGKGFVADYKAFWNAGISSPVIYSPEALTYENSVLECDITVGEEYQSFFRIAFFTRFADGANLGGIGYESVSNVMYSYVKGGSEKWPGVTNNLGVTLQAGKTYHIKATTQDGVITLFADGQKVAEQSGIADLPKQGRYGFRIWGGDKAAEAGKTVTVDNIVFRGSAASSVDGSRAELDEELWGREDVAIPVTLAEGDTVASVVNEAGALVPDTDYTVEANAIRIKKEYIAGQEGTFTLTVNFAGGASGSFTVYQRKAFQSTVYVEDFSDQDLSNWQKVSGSGTIALEEGGMRVKGETRLLDADSPLLENGEVEFILEEKNDDGGIGFLFRASKDKWQNLYNSDSARYQYLTSIWKYRNQGGNESQIAEDGTPVLKRNGVNHTFKLRYIGNVLTMWMDNQCMFTKQLSPSEIAQGQVGLTTQSSTDILVKKVTVRSLQELQPEADPGEATKTIAKGDMTVTLDAAFPRVIRYDVNGKPMDGAALPFYQVSVNAADYPAQGSIQAQTADSITYAVTVPGAQVSFDVVYRVLEDNILDMSIRNIDDSKNTVYTIGFPNQMLLSANSNEPNAKLDASTGSGDTHLTLASQSASKTANAYCTIPVVTNAGLSASMANNVLRNLSEFTYRSFDLADGSVASGFWNSDFLYRGLDGERMFAGEDLSCQVILTEDTNGDGALDWQDGANALKILVGDKIPGSDVMQNSFLHIGYNFASVVQHPFLKISDNLKRLSNLIDGFDQTLVFKGYASEGHDSGHADYADINQRAGGAEDMELMAQEAAKINATVGIHINHSEAYPEAKMFTNEVMSTKNGWSWLDQSKYIRRDVDIMNGGMDSRLDDMFQKVPDIGFVYVDTYRDDRWTAARIAQSLTGTHGAVLGTEEGSRMDRWTAWVHGPSFGDGMHRFVYNQQKDVYKNSALFRGGYNRAGQNTFMSWQHANNINNTLKQFYTEQLPQKYLMHYDVRKMTGNQADFEKNVVSKNVGGVNQIFKDGKLIANGSLVFIPWYEETSAAKDPDEAAKIYHWNPSGGESTWELPGSWNGQTEVKLYQTTQNGKTLVGTLPVENGTVTIDAKANTPYVLYKGDESVKADTTVWSVGSPIQDTSFNSRDFSIWQAASTAGNTDHIAIADDGNGVAVVSISGSEDGTLSQTMTGLVPGQKYRVSVWAGANGGKTATLTVKTPDGALHSNYTDNTAAVSRLLDHYAQDKKMQRIWVDFTMPEGGETTAQLTLSAEKSGSDGLVQFMESRIVKTDAPELPKGYAANEDFETVDQAYGIFIPETREEHTHLSETHEGYTTDTISGDWSLKLGTNVRTTPSTMRLEPHTQYTMEFKTQGGGTVQVFSETATGDYALNTSFAAGENAYEFTTGAHKDYIVRITSGARVLDDFRVYAIVDDTPPTVPQNLKAENESGSTVVLTWDASTDEDTGVARYDVYRGGEKIASTENTSYTDTAAPELTLSAYQIAAVNAGQTSSEKSGEVTVFVGNDTARPALLEAFMKNATTAVLRFSKPLAKDTAETPANYHLSGGAAVTAASLSDDGTTVTLQVGGMAYDKPVSLYTTNLTDTAFFPNKCSEADGVVLSLLSRYYKLDEAEGSTAYDFAGQENGVKDGAYSTAAGKNAGAMQFNKNEKVQLSNEALQNLDDWSFSTWVKFDGATGASQTIASCTQSGVGGDPGFWFYMNGGSRKLCLQINGTAGGSMYLESGTAVGYGEWYHVAVVKEGGTMALYQNGEKVASQTQSGFQTTGISNALRLGGNFNASGSFLHGLWGAMDEVKLYSAALPEEAVKTEAEKSAFAPSLIGERFTFDKTAGKDGLLLPVDQNGYQIVSLKMDGQELDSSAYTSTANGVLLSGEALSKLENGDYQMTLTLRQGEDTQELSFVLRVMQSALSANRKALYLAVEEAKEIANNGYTTESWNAFQAALGEAKALLNLPELTQQQADDAALHLAQAQEKLVKVNKSTLKIVLDLANAHVTAGDVDKLIPTAKEQFHKALESAQGIYDNPEATQEQVDKAWKTLMNVIHALGFVPGDKTELINLVAEAKGIVLSGYEDGAEKEAFVAALQAAEDLIADEDAMKLDIDKAYKALDEAMGNLIPKPLAGDKTELKKVIDEANVKNGQLDKYVDDAAAKKAFADALQAANGIYNKDGATQDEIDGAKLGLLTAMAGLRLRADKSSLNDWLDELKGIDLTAYTAESADVVRAVIARAEALAAQDLSEDDMERIQAMVAEMENAKAQLEKAPAEPENPENPEKPEESSKPDDSKPDEGNASKAESSSEGKDAADKAPTTGDSLPIAALSVLAVASAGAWLLSKRKP